MMAFPGQPGYERASLRGRLRRWFVLVVLVVAIVAVGAVLFATDSVQRLQASVMEQYEIENLVEVRLVSAIDAEHAAIDKYLRAPDIATVLEFEAAEDSAVEVLTRLASVERPALQPLVAGVRAAHDAWTDDWVAAALRQRGAGLEIGADVAREGEVRFASLEATIAPLEDFVLASERQLLAETDEVGRQATVLVIGIVLVFGLAAMAMGLALLRSVSLPLERLVAAVAEARRTGEAAFDVDRQDEFGALAETLEALHRDLAARYEAARVEASRAELFSRLSERLSATSDETSITEAGALAVRTLVPEASGSISLLNPSSNRLTVVAAWGEGQPAVGERLVGQPDGCPAVRRSVPHIVREGGGPLVEQCSLLPVGPDRHQGCFPMLATGKVIGVLHLDCPATLAKDAASPELARRVTEQLGLAIANARLTRTMERLAMTDSLTGLGNALSFDGRVGELLRAAAGAGRDVGVIFLDLDHFKQFNDTYGHAAGDEALRTLASTMVSCVREQDIVARYGGEEFVIAVADAGIEATATVAEKVRYAIEQMVVALGPGRYARVTASLGVAATDTHGFDAAMLLRTADAALYAAKSGGRNRVVKASAPLAAVGADETTAVTVPPERRRGRLPGRAAGRPH